jgi:hypothetical protein
VSVSGKVPAPRLGASSSPWNALGRGLTLRFKMPDLDACARRSALSCSRLLHHTFLPAIGCRRWHLIGHLPVEGHDSRRTRRGLAS